MKFMKIKQYLNGVWVELISIQIVIEEERLMGIQQDEKELIKEGLDKMKDLIFENDKVTVYSDDQVVIFKRGDGPVKIDIVTVDDKENENEFIHL